LARAFKITRGRKLLRDSTVVETDIHRPTDSRILGDGVRILSRLLHRAKEVVGSSGQVGKEAFRSRTRRVRRLAQKIHRIARPKGEEAVESLQNTYAQLIGVAGASKAQAEQVGDLLKGQTEEKAQRLVAQLT
jgi:IS5 family transposase